ncbi:MAG: peptidoglycan DD-metalloendopeptidase family protein [Anaerolineales bacterium]|nr:peptidoglycan DD-metalloendopeptidase family protein [Anaerolineales bacterium]
MKLSHLWHFIALISLLAGMASCVSTPASSNPTAQSTPSQITSAPGSTTTPPETELAAISTNTHQPVYTPTRCAPTACPRRMCTFDYTFPLTSPIASPGRDTIEPSYRFGSTQNGRREAHHGVDMTNKAGIPVLAAADGKVVVAGDDTTTVYGPMVEFYGNVIILKHDLPGSDIPIYTAYGHLLKVGVSVGQKVVQGQQIGEVGLGGVAAGTHLHFEVRYGENSYDAVRNPELWLQPHADENGQPYGVLAGRIVDAQGELLAAENIVVKKMEKDGKFSKIYYLTTYEDPAMLALAPWYDSFAIGDLPAGDYQISFIYKHEQKYVVQVQPGVVTYVYLRGEG